MEKIIDTEKEVLTRKQFLAMIGAAVGGLLFSQFFLSSKTTYVKANSYGTNNYGNKA